MKNKLSFSLRCASALLLVLLFGASQALAQDQISKSDKTAKPATKNAVKTAAQSSRGGGADTNIKTDRTANDPNTPAAKPEGKGERGSRGCAVDIVNDTGWYVDIYVNGNYNGTVGPWNSGYVYPPVMGSNLYGRASFTDGSYKYWGPREFNCVPGTINSWSLTP